MMAVAQHTADMDRHQEREPQEGPRSHVHESSVEGDAAKASALEVAPIHSPRPRGGGPKTPEGKERARLNALNHGLTSMSPVAGGESQLTWESFLNEMLVDLGAEGPAQEAAGYTIALGYWRKLRAARFEARLIDDAFPRDISPPQYSREEAMLEELECDIELGVEFLTRLSDWDESVICDSSEVLNALYLPTVLCVSGDLPEDIKFPTANEVWTIGDVYRWLKTLATHLRTTMGGLLETTVSKAITIGLVRRQLRAATPPGVHRLFGRTSSMENLLRYDAKFDRDIDRGYKLLEELQRARAGALPAPNRVHLRLE